MESGWAFVARRDHRRRRRFWHRVYSMDATGVFNNWVLETGWRQEENNVKSVIICCGFALILGIHRIPAMDSCFALVCIISCQRLGPC
jgi:hypothetical protein